MKITFEIDTPSVAIEYDRDLLRHKIRDVLVQSLIRRYTDKLTAGTINQSQVVDFLTQTFKKALSPDISKIKLKKIENIPNKFSFLPYDKTPIDDIIHGLSYKLIALCGGDTKMAKSMLANSRVLDSEGRVINFRETLTWEIAQAISKDVADLTKECVINFLDELQTTGKIMTSSELSSRNEESLSNTKESSTDTENSEDSIQAAAEISGNLYTQQRDASLHTVDDKNEETQNSNTIEAKAEYTPQTNTLFNFLLSWIYELPRWLQDQILQSTPVKVLIESIEKTALICNKKFTTEFFVNTHSPELINDSSNYIEYNMQDRVKLLDMPSEGLVDISIIYRESSILPTEAIISGNISGDSVLGGLAMNFNELNRIEVF